MTSSWIDEANVERLRGRIEPAPGGSTPGALIGVAATGNEALADNPIVFPCDGSDNALAALTAAPPSWLDGTTGQITAAGLYLAGAFVSNGGGGITTPGLFVCVHSIAFGASLGQMVSLDAIASLGIAAAAFEVVAVAVADLPFDPQITARAQADATFHVSGTAGIFLLATVAP